MTTTTAAPQAAAWQPTACILCSRNCGIEVELRDGHLARVRGDQRHPLSEGYLCQKAARLDHYQNHADRLTSPLRRRPDGTFEEVSWDLAVSEIAQRLVALREQHGGRALAYYGGGGQGNHLGGVYGRSLVEALRTRFHYSALAQEKTGDFWVNGRLFGRQTCHVAEAVEEAELVVFIGTNPYQAHGLRNARDVLRAIARDPNRTMVVIDPKRTETAALADLHLQVRPGTDAFLLAAALGLIAQAGREDRAFLESRTRGAEDVLAALREVPVDEFVGRTGVPLAGVRRLAELLTSARSASVRVDLGLQQSLHSTLNSYLEKLLFLLTGHFGRPGCNALHTFFLPLIGHSDPPGPQSRSWTTTATGLPEIGKLFPPNVLPAEIESDQPQRLRGLIVDSANPALTAADTATWERALPKLDLMVVIDVALTETARQAHYVLPASSQFEKVEATFFNMEFPTQAFHLRRPILSARPGTLPEPEIYGRLLVAMGELPGSFPLLRAVAHLDRRLPALRLLPAALAVTFALRPRLRRYAAFVLRDTLGRALPEGLEAAAPLWFAAQAYAGKHAAAVRRAGHAGRGPALGERLFEAILERPSGTPLSTHEHEDTWRLVRHADGRVHLAIPELLDELRRLGRDDAAERGAAEYPLVLIAGERRAYNANQIYRDPAWRKTDLDGALHVHPADAARLGLADGSRAVVESARGAVEASVKLTDALPAGVVTLPHGYGMQHPGGDGQRVQNGPALNRLTDAAHRDALTATPYHKHVRVRVRAPA